MRARIALFAAALLTCTSAAMAEFPERPVHIYVPAAPGAASDVAIRLVAEKAREHLGQNILIENKSGGVAGSIATRTALSAPADGYAVVYQTSAMTIYPWLSDRMTFDPEKDLTPVIRVGTTQYVVVVRADSPIRTFDDFVAHAKANPGKVSCSTIGVGAAPHLVLELINQDAGIDILHVPYRGFSLAYADLQSGRIDCSIEPPIVVRGQVQAGALRVIGHTGALADTVTGTPIRTRYPGVDVSGWGGLFVSAQTPKAVVDRLHGAFEKAINDPGIARALKDRGLQTDTETPDQFKGLVARDKARYGAIVKARQIKLTE